MFERMLTEYRDNLWFINSYWPENKRRAHLMVSDVINRKPPPARILDVGCFNGYLSCLFSTLGYQVTGTDAEDLADRASIFARHGIEFFLSNLNELESLSHLRDQSFDVVLMGEIIEHILNHPLGLIQEAARVLKPEGLLIVTTPNPSTLMNASRLLRDGYTLWGTRAFITRPKIQQGHIIDIGDVHYREYTKGEILFMLEEAGFKIEKSLYFAPGANHEHALLKRAAKSLLGGLMNNRLLGAVQYHAATLKA